MPTLRFKIGEAFPADDPVARFITIAAMMSNDWLRDSKQLLELKDFYEDAEALRMMSFRRQAALYHEAAVFIGSARRQFPTIRSFLNELPAAAKDDLDRVVGGLDAKSPHYLGPWVKAHRHITFHYPELNADAARRGKEAATAALRKARNHDGRITVGETFGSVRFDFADEVAVQWLPDADVDLTDRVAELREAVLALARFAQHAANAYLATRPEGTITFE